MHYSGISDEAGESLDLQIKAHKALGWSHIEPRNIDGTCITDLSDGDFESVAGRLKDAGQQIIGFASQLANWARPIDTDFEIDLAELHRAIPRIQQCGAKYIRTMSYPNSKENPLPEPEWRDEVVRRFQEMAKIAADGGIVLVHENCHGWASQGPDSQLEFIESVDNPALKLVFDTGNEHKHNTVKYFQAVREHIVHMHIKSWKYDGDSHKPAFPDEGDEGTRQILTELIASGYDGYLSIEPHMVAMIHLGKSADEDPELAYNLYVEFGQRLMRLMEELQSEP